MTSSLVGSEMCIRDSVRLALALAVRLAMGLVVRTCLGASAEGAQQPAVSYTHLTLPTICSV
eukprot:3014506-Prorocentrum_lima.AAC.1